MNRTTKHAIAAFLIAALACCTSWGPPVRSSRLATQKFPDQLRLSLADGRQVVILSPSVRGDTIFGDTLAYWLFQSRRVPAAIAIADIDSVSTRRLDGPMTAMAVALAAGGVFAVIEIKDALEEQASRQSCNIGRID